MLISGQQNFKWIQHNYHLLNFFFFFFSKKWTLLGRFCWFFKELGNLARADFVCFLFLVSVMGVCWKFLVSSCGAGRVPSRGGSPVGAIFERASYFLIKSYERLAASKTAARLSQRSAVVPYTRALRLPSTFLPLFSLPPPVFSPQVGLFFFFNHCYQLFRRPSTGFRLLGPCLRIQCRLVIGFRFK